MPLIRSRLPSEFKMMTPVLAAWMLIGLTYVWPAPNEVYQMALEMMRGAAWVVALPGTVYLAGVLLFLRRRKVSHAK